MTVDNSAFEHEHAEDGSCIPTGEQLALAETLHSIADAVMIGPNRLQWPAAVSAFAATVYEMSSEISMSTYLGTGNVQLAEQCFRDAIALAVFTGYRAAKGGQEIPSPRTVN